MSLGFTPLGFACSMDNGRNARADADRGDGAALERWRSVCARLEGIDPDTDLSSALEAWLKIGADLFGASGGLFELTGQACGNEMFAASFGLDECCVRALSGACGGHGLLRLPSEVEFVGELTRSEEFGGLLVWPVLEMHGARAALSLPVSSQRGFVGVVRYLLARELEPDAAMRAQAGLLSQRFCALVESRLLLRRLRAAEGRLHAILHGAGEGIAAVGPDGRILEANQAMASIFGCAREQLRGLPLTTLFPEWDVMGWDGMGWDGTGCDGTEWNDGRRVGAQPAAGGGGWSAEISARRFDGSEFVADIVAGSAEMRVARTIVVRDAGARRAAELRMRQCERLASIGTLAAGLGHDLNNTLLPMRARLSALSRLPRGGTRCEREANFDELRSGFAHLQSLADALHFLATESEPASGATTHLEQWWSLAGPLLSRALHDRATLEVAFAPSLPGVRLDEQSLSHAAMALLMNAGDAMPAERPRELSRVLVRASLSDDGQRVVLAFIDNGIGMTDTVRRRAFDAYFTTKTRAIGRGLGLPIVRSIVERVGGAIEIETKVGLGTEVRLLLPADESTRTGCERCGILRAACTIADGRLRSAVASVLEAHGVDPTAAGPDDADLWFVSGNELTADCAARWNSTRAPGRLVVLGTVQDTWNDAGAIDGAVFVPVPRDLADIGAAVRQAVQGAMEQR